MRFPMILAALPLMACGSVATGSDSGDKVAPGGGGGGSRTYAVADFTGVELAGADDVDVRVGGGFSVRAEGPARELDKLEIRKDGAMLKVGRKREANWRTVAGRGVKVYVTMPAIRAASLAGSGNLTVDKVRARDFDGALAGSGDLRIGQIAATTASLSIAGSGGIDTAGRVEQLRAAIAGSGDIDAPGLRAARADVSIAGSGNVAAEVNGPVKISIMGSGNAILGGGARCSTSKMGSGAARCS